MITSVRTASRSHCSIRIRREFFRIAASRNRIAAHGISRNLRRFSRWMMIGSDAAARPAEQREVGEAEGQHDREWQRHLLVLSRIVRSSASTDFRPE